jgi:DNA repair protein RecO (recombination protein O)
VVDVARIVNAEALVLHVKAFRESSALVHFFTADFGRVTGVMRGYRASKKHPATQPFNVGVVSLSGRGSLLTVGKFDLKSQYLLHADALNAGFYVLELLTRSLAEKQVEQRVFQTTRATLLALSQLPATGAERLAIARILREFEAILLDELGYGIDCFADGRTGQAISEQAHYAFVPEVGFCGVDSARDNAIPGALVLALGRRDWSQGAVLRASRTVFAQALIPLIGYAPIVSRSLLTPSAGHQEPVEK